VTHAEPAADRPFDLVTQPDPLDPAAWTALALMDGETIRRVWKTGRGFLVLTTLRCILLWQRRELFRPTEWQSGPEVLLFDVRPPRVLFGRFLEISPASPAGGAPIRVVVPEPEYVAEEIGASLPEARRAWEVRRHRALDLLAAEKRRHDQVVAAVRAGRPLPMVTVRCPFCGNSIPATARRCPHCGAPSIE
jgi:zinc-ribbon domain